MFLHKWVRVACAVGLYCLTVGSAFATDPGVCFRIYDSSGVESYQYDLGEYMRFDASCTTSNLADDHRAWFVPPFTGVTDPENWEGKIPSTPCWVGVLNLGTDTDPYYLYGHNTRECPFLTSAKMYSTSYYKEGSYVMRLDMTDENYQHSGSVETRSNYTMSKVFTIGRAGSTACLQEGYVYCPPADVQQIAWLIPVLSLILN